MPNYEADFIMRSLERGSIDNIPANNENDAREAIMAEILDTYDDVENVEIVNIREMLK